jgi:hypothetical protein
MKRSSLQKGGLFSMTFFHYFLSRRASGRIRTLNLKIKSPMFYHYAATSQPDHNYFAILWMVLIIFWRYHKKFCCNFCSPLPRPPHLLIYLIYNTAVPARLLLINHLIISTSCLKLRTLFIWINQYCTGHKCVSYSGNTKGGSITVPFTSFLTGLD